MKTILKKLQDVPITIEDYVTIKVINSLGPKFETYVTVLNEKVHNEKILQNLDNFLKSLEKEEICMIGKTSFNNLQTSSSSRSSQGSSGGQGRGGHRRRNGQSGCNSRGGGKGKSSTTSDYKDTLCHCYQKKRHIANHYIELALVTKDNDKSGKVLGLVHLRAIRLSQIGELKNLDLLDSGAIDHAHNSRDIFINFCPMREKACTATRERIISYSQGDVVKKFIESNIMFTNILYISALVNNLYSMSCLYY